MKIGRLFGCKCAGFWIIAACMRVTDREAVGTCCIYEEAKYCTVKYRDYTRVPTV